MTNRIFSLVRLGPARAPRPRGWQQPIERACVHLSTASCCGRKSKGAATLARSRRVMAGANVVSECPGAGDRSHRTEAHTRRWRWMLSPNVAPGRKPSLCCSKKLQQPIESRFCASSSMMTRADQTGLPQPPAADRDDKRRPVASAIASLSTRSKTEPLSPTTAHANLLVRSDAPR